MVTSGQPCGESQSSDPSQRPVASTLGRDLPSEAPLIARERGQRRRARRAELFAPPIVVVVRPSIRGCRSRWWPHRTWTTRPRRSSGSCSSRTPRSTDARAVSAGVSARRRRFTCPRPPALARWLRATGPLSPPRRTRGDGRPAAGISGTRARAHPRRAAAAPSPPRSPRRSPPAGGRRKPPRRPSRAAEARAPETPPRPQPRSGARPPPGGHLEKGTPGTGGDRTAIIYKHSTRPPRGATLPRLQPGRRVRQGRTEVAQVMRPRQVPGAQGKQKAKADRKAAAPRARSRPERGYLRGWGASRAMPPRAGRGAEPRAATRGDPNPAQGRRRQGRRQGRGPGARQGSADRLGGEGLSPNKGRSAARRSPAPRRRRHRDRDGGGPLAPSLSSGVDAQAARRWRGTRWNE